MPNKNPRPSFKKIDLAGVQTLVSWAAAEGWNPGTHDAETFYNADPDGFYGYFLGDEMIGGGSIVSYSGNFGFMGFFIMKPEFRGRGWGRKLWIQRRDTLLARLNPAAPIGMDGVVAMQPFYEKGGFKIAFKDERYARVAERFAANKNVMESAVTNVAELLALDGKCFGFERAEFLALWINQPNAKTFKYVAQGNLQGFAIIRKCVKGYKVCPLFANNYTVAEALYKACLSSLPDGEMLFLDIPLSNPDAVTLVRNFGGEYVFECARMYYGTPPQMAVENVFGLTSFELG
jgi:GNAT superfamily N-acetyltransferase